MRLLNRDVPDRNRYRRQRDDVDHVRILVITIIIIAVRATRAKVRDDEREANRVDHVRDLDRRTNREDLVHRHRDIVIIIDRIIIITDRDRRLNRDDLHRTIVEDRRVDLEVEVIEDVGLDRIAAGVRGHIDIDAMLSLLSLCNSLTKIFRLRHRLYIMII